tara:strand:+ start:146946 stop:147065 length:120 start_codon:yes stop_codon:yes gene_type:complete
MLAIPRNAEIFLADAPDTMAAIFSVTEMAARAMYAAANS